MTFFPKIRSDSFPLTRRIILGWLLAFFLMPAAGRGQAPAAPDPFYARKTIYVTWIMIWNGSTEKGWWKPTDYNGCQVQVDGTWQSINWNDRRHIRAYFDAIRAAGINVIAVDFTNGFRWEWQAKYVQQLCAENGLKMVIAFNPEAGKSLEAGATKIWKTYAGPEAANAGAYFQRDGKPLMVLYTWRKGYETCLIQDGENRRRFATVWASGEDTEKNKWGWQLEPEVGPVASADAMFVTASLKFGGVKAKEEGWRRHLAWLDYGFICAQRSAARYRIVGSFDDVHERNAWMVTDTSKAALGWQTRDITGALSNSAAYERVSDWVLRGKPRTVPGGLIRDGAYRVRAAGGQVVGVEDNRAVGSPGVLKADADRLDNYVWVYHLGQQEYRLIKLNAGLALEGEGDGVRLNWDNDAAGQRWTARKSGKGFVFLNKATGRALDYEDKRLVTRPLRNGAPSQQWTLLEAALVP